MRSLLAIFCAVVPFTTASAQSLGLRVPPGFEVTEFADSKLANDIYCMTVDPKGRIVVSGRNYIRILIDDDNDGRADRALDFSNTPKDGAMGLLWEGSTLYVTGDGGLRRFHDKNGDDKADGPSELIRAMKTGGEHHAHAILRGPDGWLYVLCGNNTGIDKSFAQTKTSPIKDPVAGCVIRFSPDLKTSEIVAHGFRNPYSMDFNSDGELFTYDSDNERCVSLPWYEPTRFYQVLEGGHYGWLSPQKATFWRMPPYHPDVVAPVAYLGRGSPTGVACYRHAQFPQKYRGGLFLADWTFGRVYFIAPQRKEERYTGQPDVFLQAAGENGFAPTALTVHPDSGDLYVSVGGRGTRGAVYRVRYREGTTKSLSQEAAKWRMTKGPVKLKVIWPATKPFFPDPTLLETITALQQSLGEIGDPKKRGTVWEGYSLRRTTPTFDKTAKFILGVIRSSFPSGDSSVDREWSRTLALIEPEDPKWLTKVTSCFDEKSDPVNDVHYLIVLSRLGGDRPDEVTRQTAETLISLDAKIQSRGYRRDTHWPLRIKELYAELSRRDPKLDRTMIANADFGRPDHALFVQAPGFDKQAAARIFARKIKAKADYPLAVPVVSVLAHLPVDESFPLLRNAWGKAGVDAAILPVLAQKPEPIDRTKFIQGLSHSAELLRICIEALDKLPAQNSGDEALALIRALGNLPDTQKDLRKTVGERLGRLTNKNFGTDKQGWTSWFITAHPDVAGRLNNPDGVDVPAWEKRLARLDWSAGDEQRGSAVFVKASCLTCHSGTQALGPDLAGVTGRFSRDDLFRAILQPSREVPARYQATFVETNDGKVYQGLVIYEAVDSLILQTGAAATVRIAGEQVASKRTSSVSLMPAGLLDPLSDTEIVDLYAYLKSLGKTPGN